MAYVPNLPQVMSFEGVGKRARRKGLNRKVTIASGSPSG